MTFHQNVRYLLHGKREKGKKQIDEKTKVIKKIHNFGNLATLVTKLPT